MTLCPKLNHISCTFYMSNMFYFPSNTTSFICIPICFFLSLQKNYSERKNLVYSEILRTFFVVSNGDENIRRVAVFIILDFLFKCNILFRCKLYISWHVVNVSCWVSVHLSWFVTIGQYSRLFNLQLESWDLLLWICSIFFRSLVWLSPVLCLVCF